MKIGISSHNNRNRQQILSYLNYLQKTRTLFETKEYEFGADLLKDLNKGIRFDVIFLDPPYQTDYVSKSVSLIVSLGLLSKDGIIVCEHASNDNFDYAPFEVYDEKKYGNITLTFLEKKN